MFLVAFSDQRKKDIRKGFQPAVHHKQHVLPFLVCLIVCGVKPNQTTQLMIQKQQMIWFRNNGKRQTSKKCKNQTEPMMQANNVILEQCGNIKPNNSNEKEIISQN